MERSHTWVGTQVIVITGEVIMRIRYILLLVGILLISLAAGCASFTSTTSPTPARVSDESWGTLTTLPLATDALQPSPSRTPLLPTITKPTATAITVYETEVVLSTLSPMSVVHALDWLNDGVTLRYAYGSGVSTEPKYWQWRIYNTNLGSTQIISPPQSSVSTSVREQLGLCTQSDDECWHETRLYESPSGAHIVYAPSGATGEFGTGELWYVKADGSQGRRIQGQFISGSVTWSPKEDYFLIDVGWDFPEPLIVDTQALTASRLLDIVGLEVCPEPYTTAKFDPNGNYIVFTARSEGEKNCQLWQVEPTGDNLESLTDVWGNVSWSRTGQTLYVLHERQDAFAQRWLVLYKIDLISGDKQAILLSESLPYCGFLTGNFIWSVAPNERAIAYPDAAADDGLYIVHFGRP